LQRTFLENQDLPSPKSLRKVCLVKVHGSVTDPKFLKGFVSWLERYVSYECFVCKVTDTNLDFDFVSQRLRTMLLDGI